MIEIAQHRRIRSYSHSFVMIRSFPQAVFFLVTFDTGLPAGKNCDRLGDLIIIPVQYERKRYAEHNHHGGNKSGNIPGVMIHGNYA
jgi:hypothetical protein